MTEATAAPELQTADIQRIMQLLPHRYPFLLVDRILEIEEGKRIVGLKNVTINEPFFQGHFPGHPIMPGVLIIESMAQVGGMLLMRTIAVSAGITPRAPALLRRCSRNASQPSLYLPLYLSTKALGAWIGTWLA